MVLDWFVGVLIGDVSRQETKEVKEERACYLLRNNLSKDKLRKRGDRRVLPGRRRLVVYTLRNHCAKFLLWEGIWSSALVLTFSSIKGGEKGKEKGEGIGETFTVKKIARKYMKESTELLRRTNFLEKSKNITAEESRESTPRRKSHTAEDILGRGGLICQKRTTWDPYSRRKNKVAEAGKRGQTW